MPVTLSSQNSLLLSFPPFNISDCRYLATCALDRKLKVWDLRSAYDPLSEIQLPISANTIAYSQRGLLAIGAGNTVQVKFL